MSLQYGERRPTNAWDLLASLGQPGKFQRVSRLGFVTTTTSLNGGQPNCARCLAVSCTGILYMHFGGLLPPDKIYQLPSCKIHFASKFCILVYWQHYCTALEQRPSAKHCGMVLGMELRNFRRGRHLCSAGRLSRLASVHILVLVLLICVASLRLLLLVKKTVTSLLPEIGDKSLNIWQWKLHMYDKYGNFCSFAAPAHKRCISDLFLCRTQI